MSNTNDLDRDEKVLRHAVQFLIDGGEFDAAQILLHCDINIGSRLFRVRQPHEYTIYYLTVALSGPRLAYDVIETKRLNRHPLGESIRRAFEAVIRQDQRIENLTARMRSMPIDAGEWRIELWERIEAIKADTQETDNNEAGESKDSAEIEEQEMTNPLSGSSPDPRKVFVVHGRNNALRQAIFDFLRSIDLQPIEWEQAVLATGKASPYIGDILDAGFAMAQAVVVMMTPDDEARLLPELQGQSEPEYETELTRQARPNVLFEAGMAFGRHEDRTVLVEFGALRPVSDVSGRHTVRMDGSSEKRQALAMRLESAGCQIDITGTDWHKVGDFTVTSLAKKSRAKNNRSANDGRLIRDSHVQKLRNQYASLLEGIQILYRCADTRHRLVDNNMTRPKGLTETIAAAKNQVDLAMRDLRVEPGTANICELVESFYAEHENHLLKLEQSHSFLGTARLADRQKETMKKLVLQIRKAVDSHLASFNTSA